MTLATPTTPPSADALEAARLFLDDLDVDPDLRRAWNALDAQGQSLSPQARRAAADGFLAAHGYDTTAEDVARIAAEPVDPATVPNADAIQFAMRLLTEGALRREWDAALTAVAGGPEPDLAPVNALLAREGVGANAMQVAKASVGGADAGIGTWAGTYGDTTIVQGTDRFPGPTLIVTGSYVALGTHRIVREAFDGATQTLSWTAEGGMNTTAASIVFARRTDPAGDDPYLGSTFSGRLTLPDQGYALRGEVSFTGRLGPATQQPPSTTSSELEAIKNAGVVVALVVGGATVLNLAYRFRKFFSRRWEEVRTRYRRWRGQDADKLDAELAADVDMEAVDALLGFRKYAEVGRLAREIEDLSVQERLGPEGRDLLDRLDKVREGLTEEQQRAYEENRDFVEDYLKDAL